MNCYHPADGSLTMGDKSKLRRSHSGKEKKNKHCTGSCARGSKNFSLILGARTKGDYFVAFKVSLSCIRRANIQKRTYFRFRLHFCRSLESNLQAQAPEQRLVMEPVPFKVVSFRSHARATPRLVSFQDFHMGVSPPPPSRKAVSSY